MVKKVLSITLWILTAVTIITVLAVGRYRYRNAPVKNIVITKEYDNSQGSFLNDSLITASLLSLCDTGHSKVKDIDISRIEDTLDLNPWIESAKAFTGVDRELNIKINEHQAAMRIFNSNGYSAYVSKNGFVFPTSGNMTPHVVVASGNFGDIHKITGQLNDSLHQHFLIKEALRIALAIDRNEFIKACIGQIYLNNDEEFELIPNTNNDIVILVGNADNIDDKLLRTSIFLKEKINTEEFDTYSKLNAKYKNQIVCTKK